MPVCHCIRLSGKCKAHYHFHSFLIHIFSGASVPVPRAFVVFSHSLRFFFDAFGIFFSFHRIPFPFKNALLYAAARCGKISVCESVPVAQLDRALDSDSKGQRFESSRVHSSSRTTLASRRLFYSKKVISRPFRRSSSPEPNFVRFGVFLPFRRVRFLPPVFVDRFARTTPRSRRLFYSKKVISRPFRRSSSPEPNFVRFVFLLHFSRLVSRIAASSFARFASL